MIEFVDLAALHEPLRSELHAALDEIISSSAFIGGRAVTEFEEQWAAYCGVGHCVSVGNGTDALELILEGLGIGPGDEVIVPANTFVATAEAVVRVGAQPVFCDVDPETLLVTAATATPALGPRTAAIIAVHLYGQMADVGELGAFAQRHGLLLLEDAAQAHGAWFDGVRAGAAGAAAGFSFYPGKNLGALGDGGAVTTDDAELAARIRVLAQHGRAGGHHEHTAVGRNSRLDGLQAAFLSFKLAGLDAGNAGRRSAHDWYAELLPSLVRQVAVHPKATAVHHLEVVRVARRDDLRSALEAAGIGVGLHYPTPVHRMAPYAGFRCVGAPVVEQAAREILSLPMHPLLDRSEVELVAKAVDASTGRFFEASHDRD